MTERYVEQYMLDHVVEQMHLEILKAEQQSRRSKKRARTSLASVQAELDRLNTMYQKGRISENYYDSQYDILSRKLDELKTPSITVESFAPLQKLFSGDWEAVYDELDAEHRNAFWKSIVTEIRLDMNTRKISDFSFRI